MKVLHIITTLGTGGAEKLLLETIPLYNKKGIEADVLVLYGTDNPFLNQLKELNCCNVYTLKSRSYYSFNIIFKIIPYLKKYDLIHTHLFSAQYFTVFAKILSGIKVPLIFTEHSTSNRRFNKKKFQLLDKMVYNSYSKTIAITDVVKEAILKQTNISENKINVIHNGINLENISVAGAYDKASINQKINNSDTILIQVSSFQYPKDQATIIKSLPHLPEDVKLILVGDGVDKQQSIELVNELELNDRVLFLGLRNDVPSLLKTADIIVLSSKYEGLSLSSIEGMASGKPFIASDVPGLKDIIAGAGILFPQGDDKALADEIIKLMNDKEHYNQVVERCQARASKYDIHQMVDKTIELYQEILSK